MGADVVELPDPLMTDFHVCEYLRSIGYTVSNSQPSRWRKSGLIVPGPKGGYSQASIRKFARSKKIKRAVGVPVLPDEPEDEIGENWGAEYSKNKALLVKENLEKESRKNAIAAGKLIPKAEHVPAIIAAIHILERNVRTRIAKASRAAVTACGGNLARRQALVVVMNDAVDDAMRVIHDTEQFQVMFKEWGDE